MADYILDTVNQTAKMDWAYTFQRTGAFPLDRTTLFSSYNDAVLYALGGSDERGLSGTSYVGQSISVYDAEKSSVTLYIIEVDRSLKEVGSAPIGDNLSIEVVNGVVQLKNFGKGYYKYIPAVKNENTGEITTPSNYEFVENDFIAGLEPRVVLNTRGNLEIAWYEPSEETIDGVNTKVESITNTVDTLEEVINAEGGLVDQVDNLQQQIGTAADGAGNEATGLYAEIERVDKTLSLKANAADVYTKEATNNAISAAIGETIAKADHLKREVVNILPDASDADANTIYMVPSGLLEDDNKYYEWILIDGIFEQVGSWEVDLSVYAKIEDLNKLSNTVSTLTQTVTDNKTLAEQAIVEEQSRAEAAEQANAKTATDALTAARNAQNSINVLEETIEDRLLSDDDKSKLEKLVIAEDGSVGISGTINASNVKELDTWLEDNSADYVKDLTENNLSEELSNKINFITAINPDQFEITDGTLKIISINGDLITNLSSNTEFNTIKIIGESNASRLTALESMVIDNQEDIAELKLNIVNINSNFDNYVLKTNYEADMKEIRDILTWQEMPGVSTN